MDFLFTPGPWLPGKRNRRYGMTAGIFASPNGKSIELGRMYIGSPEYEANFALVLAAPLLVRACDVAFDFLGGVDDAVDVRGLLLEALLAATTPVRSAQ